MSKYLMTLRPLDTFFFGQENKYRKRQEGNDRDKLYVIADYYQESGYFPQQTTLLGALRYYLLMVNGQLPIEDQDKAAGLIGPKSFRITDEMLSFGCIKSLSPVVLTFNDRYYCPQPLDMHVEEGALRAFKQEPISIRRTSLPNHNGSLVFFPDYEEKTGLAHLLMDMSDPSKYRSYQFDLKTQPDGVFVPEERVGILKGEEGQTQDAAFYKQVAYRLREGAAFVCIVEVEDEHIKDGHEGIVPMGAEKSLFKIKFESTDKSLENLLKLEENDRQKLVLLSDAYLPDGFQQHYHFSISNSQPFRFLETETHKKYKYDRLHFSGKQNGETIRSERYNLFRRGSVFYFKTAEDLAQMKRQLEGEFNFRKIGYNYFACN